LVDDLLNDEMGKTILNFDLEQVRFFNTSYNLNALLGISPLVIPDEVEYEHLGYVGIWHQGMGFYHTLPVPFPVLNAEWESNPDFYEFGMPEEFADQESMQGFVLVPGGWPSEAAAIVFGGNGHWDNGDYEFVFQAGTVIDNFDREWKIFPANRIIRPDEPLTHTYNGINFSSHGILDIEYYWDGETPETSFSEESSVGQIFINNNLNLGLKETCKLELNTGNLTGKSIYDSSGNVNKGLLIGDYKIKKPTKTTHMRRDTYIKVPKKTNNSEGAL